MSQTRILSDMRRADALFSPIVVVGVELILFRISNIGRGSKNSYYISVSTYVRIVMGIRTFPPL